MDRDDHIRVTSIKFVPVENVTGQRDAVATFDDKSSSKCFSYFIDEHSFSAEEFIGMTKDEVRRHFVKKDKAYLSR